MKIDIGYSEESGHMFQIRCDGCQTNIGNFAEFESVPEVFKALNNGEHECGKCKGSRHQRYNDYVDPKNAYH